MDKLYLDTNFLLDLAVKDCPEAEGAAALFDIVAEGQVLACVFTSSLILKVTPSEYLAL